MNPGAESNYSMLSELIESNSLPQSVMSRIQNDLKIRNLLSSVIINVKDRTVMHVPVTTLLSTSRSDESVLVSDYELWRQAEADHLTNEYDRQRFVRSTVIEVLCAKVNEHSQYSFIARTTIDDSSDDSIVKYSFIKVCPQCDYILGTRQDITKSLEHDIVTGGLNREGLLREITQRLSLCTSSSQYSLLCFNIKNFRIINEVQGNAIGDKVLQHFYTAIVYSDLHPVSYARYESDNFICLIRRENLDTDVIARLCLQECVTDGHHIVYRSLCGIFHIEDPEVTAYYACSHAKLATSFIKDQFITPWIVFDKKMINVGLSDSEVLDHFDAALEGQEFVPFFQPVVSLKTGRIEMAEALVRWKSPKHGMVSPAVFIPVLERNGGLSRIDKLMENKIFEMQRQRLNKGLPVVPIDLNLSWSDFADTRLITQLQDHILDPSVPTDLVRFEITESAYEEIAENRMDVLNFFQKHDVKIAVDDFGQGYSFGTMKNVDFHIVKLDKSMIDKLGQSRKMDLLVKTLIGVFHSLNSKVVAEGVENERQVQYLREAGCDYIQGFYFYRPMDEQSFLSLLESQQQTADTNLKSPVADESPIVDESIIISRQRYDNLKEQLRKSNEETRCLRKLIDEMGIHYFEWDVNTHEDLASDGFCQMYGLPSNIIPNMPEDCPLVVEDDRERFRTFYGRIARGEKMGNDSFRLYTPDGKGFSWFRKTFFTIFDSKGLPSKAIITMQDTTDKYRYRILRTRDHMLTKQQEIVTFIYTLADDTISITYLNDNNEVSTSAVHNFLSSPSRDLLPDQCLIADNLRECIAHGPRTGYFDHNFESINLEYRVHYARVDGEYGHLYAIIGQAEDIKKTRERLTAAERLIEMARIDGLTGVLNRATGEQEVVKSLTTHRSGVFILLDCDHFKMVNDTYGHIYGDKVLKSIADVMCQVNDIGINMRLGGDEFAFCILDDNATPEKVQTIAQEFFRRIDQIQIPGLEDYHICISVGCVIFDGDSALDFDSLYRSADMLLYQSKAHPGHYITIQ